MSPDDPIAQALDSEYQDAAQNPLRAEAIMKMLPRLVGAENPVKTYSGLPTTGQEVFADVASGAGAAPSGIPGDSQFRGPSLDQIYSQRAGRMQNADISNAQNEVNRANRVTQFLQLMSKDTKPVVVGKSLVDPTTGKVLFSEDQADKTKLFGNVDPTKFTPESLAAFQQSGDYSALVPREGDTTQMTPLPGVPGVFYAKDKTGRTKLTDASGRELTTAEAQAMAARQAQAGAMTVTMGAPVVVDTPQGPRLVQPPNRPGASAQVVEVPGLGPVTPNTPTTNRQAELKEKAALTARQAQVKAKNISDAVDQAMTELKKAGFTGSAGERVLASNIPGTVSKDLQNTIDTIKANIGFQELADMRAASPTGGALGQIAIRELDFLQRAVASLEIGQSTQRLSANLQKIKTHFNAWKDAMNKAASEAPGQQGQQQPTAAPSERKAVGGKNYIKVDGQWFEE